jgi:adhesin HecA-like repeat protein
VLGNANLFLINPNGIIFGPNAKLDLRGAFVGSTADSILFDNNFQFSASNPQAPPLLTINIPLGLRFRENSGDITSQGNLSTPSSLTLKAYNLNLSGQLQAGENLTLEAQNNLTIRDSITSPFLAIAKGNLLLQGNQKIDIFALNNPQSALVSGKDMTLRSPNPISGDAHYWSGGIGTSGSTASDSINLVNGTHIPHFKM